VRAWLDEDAVLMAALRASLEARAGEPCGVFGDLIEGACTPRVETRAPHPLKAAATPGREAFPTIAEVARAPDERDDGEGVSGVGSAAEALLAPVLPSGDVVSTEKAGGRSLTSRLAAESRDERSAVAWRFMDWLKAGLAEGTIRVNEPRALVHGVDEGMLLVSPRIFRKFVEQALRDPGGAPCDPREAVKRVQRAVLRAGWHVQAPGGINLRTYQVVCGKRAGSRLSGVVIRDAARFVDPAPSVDPALVRTPDA
jgi:hypothetical protein